MPRKTNWVLSSLNTKTFEGDLVAFNIGDISGKGDIVHENLIFFNGKVEKVGKVKPIIRRNGFRYNYLGDWSFVSDDDKLELIFEPVLEIKKGLNLLLFKNRSRKIIGFYSGKLKLDNGKEILIEKALGYTEKNDNLW